MDSKITGLIVSASAIVLAFSIIGHAEQVKFFPLPGLGGASGGSNGLGGLLNCRPLNRTLVQQGGLCIQPNITAMNCQNQTCKCNPMNLPQPNLPQGPSIPLPSIPFLPSKPGSGGSGGGLPFPISLSVWNCTTSSNSTNSTETPSLRPLPGGSRG